MIITLRDSTGYEVEVAAEPIHIMGCGVVIFDRGVYVYEHCNHLRQPVFVETKAFSFD